MVSNRSAWLALFGEGVAEFAEEVRCALKDFEVVGAESLERRAYGLSGCSASLLEFLPTGICQRDRACASILGVGATFHEVIGYKAVDNPGHCGLGDRFTRGEFAYAKWPSGLQIGKDPNCNEGAPSI